MPKNIIIENFCFLKTLTPKKVFNGFLLRFSYCLSFILGCHIHWGKPESLSIEPANICNLQCPECSLGNKSIKRNSSFLSEEDYKKVLTEFGTWLFNLNLYFQGEPFLNPLIYNFIEIATRQNIYTTISTNGQFLTPENSKKTVLSGLSRIIISIDGTSQETFEKYRVGGSLNLALNGIKNIKEAKKLLKKHNPYIVIQFVVFRINEHQVSEIKSIAKNLGVELVLKSAQIEDFTNGNCLIPENENYSRYVKKTDGKFYLKRNNKFKCWRIWSYGVVTADSQLLPCCFDKNADFAYGNPTQNAWKSNLSTLFRKKVWNSPHKVQICNNCSEGVKPIIIRKFIP